MNVVCPLCRAPATRNIGILRTADIVHLWIRCAAISTINEFKSHDPLELRVCPTCDFRFIEPLMAGSETFYNDLHEKPWYIADDRFEFGKAASLIEVSETVLEIGAGKGYFPSHLLAKNYIGLEYSAKAVKDAQERGIDLRQESIEEHAILHKNIYDVVCSFQVLEHVSNPRSFLEAAISCLKPKGRLMISVPGNDSFVGSAVNALMNLPPHHVSRWSDKCIQGLPQFLEITLESLLTEPLAKDHLSWYLQTLFTQLLWPQSALVRRDTFFMMASRILHALSLKLASRFSPQLRPRGHTVLAIYCKP